MTVTEGQAAFSRQSLLRGIPKMTRRTLSGLDTYKVWLNPVGPVKLCGSRDSVRRLYLLLFPDCYKNLGFCKNSPFSLATWEARMS